MKPVRNALDRIAVLAAAALLAGCAARPMQVANPKYKGADLKSRTLLVAPLDSVLIENMDDFRDDWAEKDGESDPAVSLSAQYAKAAASLVDHAAVVADTGSVFGPEDFESIALEVPAKDAAQELRTFRYPAASALRKRGTEPDLVLQAFDLRFSRGATDGGGGGPGTPIMVSTPAGTMNAGTMGGGGGGSVKFLELTGSYIVWDYRAGAPVAYGKVRALAPFNFAMTRENWVDCLDNAVRLMVKNSAFKGRKYEKAIAPATPNL